MKQGLMTTAGQAAQQLYGELRAVSAGWSSEL